MLSLNEIRCIALLVQSSDDEAAAWTTVVFPGYKIEVGLLTHFDGWLRNVNVPEDAGDAERGILDSLELLQKSLVESKATHVVDAVWVGLPHNAER